MIALRFAFDASKQGAARWQSSVGRDSALTEGLVGTEIYTGRPERAIIIRLRVAFECELRSLSIDPECAPFVACSSLLVLPRGPRPPRARQRQLIKRTLRGHRFLPLPAGLFLAQPAHLAAGEVIEMQWSLYGRGSASLRGACWVTNGAPETKLVAFGVDRSEKMVGRVETKNLEHFQDALTWGLAAFDWLLSEAAPRFGRPERNSITELRLVGLFEGAVCGWCLTLNGPVTPPHRNFPPYAGHLGSRPQDGREASWP